MKKNKIMKSILSYVLVFIIMLFVFCIAMITAYALPNDKIQNHIIESKNQLLNLNSNPFFVDSSYIKGGENDVFTDSLIMNTAMNKGKNADESVIIRAFENSRYSTESGNQTESLQKTIEDSQLYNNQEYSRYWHGIQTIIRPLLIFFNYEQIKFLFIILMFILLTVVAIYLYKNLGLFYAISLVFSMFSVCFFIVPASLQYISVFAITLISIIIINILYQKDLEKLYPYLFFVIGGITTFFDLLTVPLITLGIPLIILILLENKKGNSIKRIFIDIIKLSLLWCLSYTLIFFSKWVIASIVLQKDVITDAINNILFRVNGNEQYSATRLGAIEKNIQYLYNKVLAVIGIVLLIIWFVGMIKNRKNLKKCKIVVLLCILAIYPYAWYFMFAGHSTIHTFFTYRLQVITIFAILCIMIETTKKENLKISDKSRI